MTCSAAPTVLIDAPGRTIGAAGGRRLGGGLTEERDRGVEAYAGQPGVLRHHIQQLEERTSSCPGVRVGALGGGDGVAVRSDCGRPGGPRPGSPTCRGPPAHRVRPLGHPQQVMAVGVAQAQQTQVDAIEHALPREGLDHGAIAPVSVPASRRGASPRIRRRMRPPAWST